MKFALLLTLAALPLHAQVISSNQVVTASWERFSDRNQIMANGRRFNPKAFCCATRLYALGTHLLVTDAHNGLKVRVTVTDRPNSRYSERLDLSPAAFSVLNGLQIGICDVRCQVGR